MTCCWQATSLLMMRIHIEELKNMSPLNSTKEHWRARILQYRGPAPECTQTDPVQGQSAFVSFIWGIWGRLEWPYLSRWPSTVVLTQNTNRHLTACYSVTVYMLCSFPLPLISHPFKHINLLLQEWLVSLRRTWTSDRTALRTTTQTSNICALMDELLGWVGHECCSMLRSW